MDATSFYRAGVRLGLLDAQKVIKAQVKLSRYEQGLFDRDPLHFFFNECGLFRRAQIFSLIDFGGRPAPVVAGIRNMSGLQIAAE